MVSIQERVMMARVRQVPQCVLIYFIKMAKYGFLEETDSCERSTCFFHVNSLLHSYLVTSGENVRAFQYLIVTLSRLGQSTSPFAPTNYETRKNKDSIKPHRPTFYPSFIYSIFYRYCPFSLQLSHQFGLQRGEQYNSVDTAFYVDTK